MCAKFIYILHLQGPPLAHELPLPFEHMPFLLPCRLLCTGVRERNTDLKLRLPSTPG